MKKLVMFSFCFVLFSYSELGFSQADFTVSINGTIVNSKSHQESKSESENGVYWCTYDIKEVTDEMRRLTNFRFYENDLHLFTLSEIPGSDVEISNSGNIVFYDHSYHFNGKIKLLFYSKSGNKLVESNYEGANLFGFSPSGNLFGVGSPNGIQISSLIENQSFNYPKGFQFSISEDDRFVGIASENLVEIYKDNQLYFKINTEFKHTRKLLISSTNNLLAIINKNQLLAYSLDEGKIRFSHTLPEKYSFRDLHIIENKIAAGIHHRTKKESRGEMMLLNLDGSNNQKSIGESKNLEDYEMFQPNKSNTGYKQIPWPFIPFDSMRTVWNHYEQHMGGYGSDYSYLHQGLDLITPIAEPTYAVQSGVVKCVLTLGGAVYWRLAISESNVEDHSNGWLYAHLIENTIQFDVGDTVEVHDYLGDIVEWTSEWGHIHFVEIKDSGFVWLYNDNEWGINFNPLLALTPVSDITPPLIDDVFTNQKFGFCTNETSQYQNPNSLSGDIDIIVKVIDYAGDSDWQQPAFKIDYWIKRIADDSIVVPRRMAHILNHSYPFYSGDNYEPFATVIYKRDEVLIPTSWMQTERNFHHIITNSDGDSIISLEEKYLALHTNDYYDSVYRIYVEVFDQSGNSAIDSMDVYFNNGISSIDALTIPTKFNLYQNYPNPFNPSTKISWQSPIGGWQTLKIYDVLGNEVTTLVNEYKNAGSYEVNFDASKLSSGIYFYHLRAGSFVETKKMLLLK